MHRKQWILSTIFMLIVFSLIGLASYVSKVGPYGVLGQRILYENETEESIDIAFIGSSAVSYFFDVMTVWDEYGVTSMSYHASGMPIEFVIPMIELINETQSPEVYVIELRNLVLDEYTMQTIGSYRNSDKEALLYAMDLYSNPFDRVDAMESSGYFNYTYKIQYLEQLWDFNDFSFGIYAWIKSGFSVDAYDYKGNGRWDYIVADMTEEYVDLDFVEENQEYELSDFTINRLEEIFQYCENNNLNVYFTFTPYLWERAGMWDQDIRREIGELIIANGYCFKDFRQEIEEVEFDYQVDFYDPLHTNPIGAEKFTLYAMEYILDAYPIEPEYDQEVINDWNETYARWDVYNEEQLEGLYQTIDEMYGVDGYMTKGE